MPINPSGLPCHCGSVGCWETEIGEGALLRRAGQDPDGGREAVDEVLREVTARVERQEPPVKLVVWDLSTSPYVDLAGARMLVRLSRLLAERGIELHLAEAHAEVRDLLREEGLESAVGHISRRTSVEDLIETFQKRP